MLVAAPAAADTRPTAPGTGTYGQANYAVPEQQPYCGAHGCIHWVAASEDAPSDLGDANANGVPDSIEAALRDLEDDYVRETAPPPRGLGWRAPLPDSGLGGDDRVDLYFKSLHGAAYGVAPRDDAQTSRAVHGFVLIDRAYASPATGGPLHDLLAHELNHLVQYAYDGWFESWYAEATATWTMDRVAPAGGYLASAARYWATVPGLPLVARWDTAAARRKSYGSAVWNRWLAHRYGGGIVREVWEASGAQPRYLSFTPRSTNIALAAHRKAGRPDPSFFDEFVRFAAATAEWRTAGFGPAANLPDVRRRGVLAAGGKPRTPLLDHTAYSLFDVRARKPASVTLRVRAPHGVRAAVALVARSSHGVTTHLRELAKGGTGEVRLARPGRFQRVTAVVVNADASRAADHKDRTGQWTFAADRQRFTVRLSAATPPRGRRARTRAARPAAAARP